MDDLISRQAAIDAVKSYWKNEVDRIPKKSIDFDVFTQICDSILTHNANICKAIDKLPSEQPKQYWIDSEGKISALPSAQLATDTNVGDTISRKGVFIPDITVEMFRNASLEGVEDLMASGEMEDISLPSAQPQWIPCSERLPEHPENDDYYLVTIQCEHYDGWDDYVTGFAEWTKHGWDELSCYIGQIKVIAWMPLPEPYGGESE